MFWIVPLISYGLAYSLPHSQLVYESRTFFLTSHGISSAVGSAIMAVVPDQRLRVKMTAMYMFRYLYYLSIVKQHPVRSSILPMYLGSSLMVFVHILLSKVLEQRKFIAVYFLTLTILDLVYYLRESSRVDRIDFQRGKE